MKINRFTSISAKLFYFTTVLVVLVVSAISYQNSKSYRKMLLQGFQDSSLDRGENIRITLENYFSGIESQLKTTLTTILSVRKRQKKITVNNFLENNKNTFIALEIFKQKKKNVLEPVIFSFTNDFNLIEFESKNPISIASKLKKANKKWLLNKTKKSNDSIFLSSFTSTIGLPIITYAKNYKDSKTKQSYWVILSIWQKQFSSLLDGSKDNKITIVDKDGKIFSSKNISNLNKGISLRKTKIFRRAKKDKQGRGSAFIGAYKDKKGKSWLGSYQKIDALNLILFLEKNADIVTKDINSLVLKTARWGFLFILIAILFSYIGSLTATKNLKNVILATEYISKGNFNAKLRANSSDEIGFLSRSINLMAQQIKNLLESQVQKVRFEKELETANAVQTTLFPKKELFSNSLSIVGYSIPASECGGDWWGYFQDGKDKTFILIADAMGHGVPAALVTAMAYSNCMTLQSFSKDNDLEKELTPKNFLERFNRVLFDAVEGSISMSFFALLIDSNKKTITFANAGHNFPVLLPKDPEDDRIKKKNKKLQKFSPITPITLKQSGNILGIDRDSTFEESTMPVKEGDKIFLFTDGLIECTSPNKKSWGKKTLLEKLLVNIHQDASSLKDTIKSEAFDFFGDEPRIDDITLVVTEITNLSSSGIIDSTPTLELSSFESDESSHIAS